MLVHQRVTPSIKFAGTHLYTWVEGGTVSVRVKYLSQEHNTMSPARARTLTTWVGGKCINPEASMPLLQFTLEGQILMFLEMTTNARILPCWQFYNIQFQLTVPRCIPFNGVHVCTLIWNGNRVLQFFPSLRYQCTPKLTTPKLPNFSYWYSQVHLIEFFQLQKILRKKVSFRQSYNGKQFYEQIISTWELSTSCHDQLKCH